MFIILFFLVKIEYPFFKLAVIEFEYSKRDNFNKCSFDINFFSTIFFSIFLLKLLSKDLFYSILDRGGLITLSKLLSIRFFLLI